MCEPGLSFCIGQMRQLFHRWSSLGCHFVGQMRLLFQPGLSFCGADEAAISSLVQPGLSFCRGLMLGRAWVVILYGADEAAISALLQPGCHFVGQMRQLFHPWSRMVFPERKCLVEPPRAGIYGLPFCPDVANGFPLGWMALYGLQD